MSTPRRQHLAILTFDFFPDVGGVQTYLYEIARRLMSAYKVSIVTPVEGRLPPDAGLHKIGPTAPHLFGFWRNLATLQPDRVLVGHAHPQLLLAALLAGRRYSVLVHGNDFLAAQRCWHASFFYCLLKRAELVIANSEATGERLRAFASRQTVTIHPGADTTVFTPPACEPPYPPVLVSVGRLVPRKGIDTVLEALPVVCKVFPNVHYYIAGDGPERSPLEMLARKHGIEANVSFLGRVSEGDLRALYRQSHVFVLPAREEPEAASIEGFGIVYLEASASGLPVVAGRSGGAVEAVRHRETGYLVDPHDPDELADILLTLLKDRALREKMGHAGRRWVEEEMNWDRAAREMATMLESLPC